MLEKIRPFLGPGILALAALTILAGWNLHHRQLNDARRDAEAAKLALQGQIVASQENDKSLRGDIETLLAANEMLKAAYDAARAASPGARPTAAATLSTGRVRVQGQSPPSTPKPAPAPVGVVPVTPDNDLSGDKPPEAQCVLHDGDDVDIEAQVITFATRENNLLIAGIAGLWREVPPPRAKLAEGKFTATLSDVQALQQPQEPRWGAALLGLCTREGCGAGGAVLFPPVRLIGLRWEAQAGLYAGPVLGAQGQLGARW